jgi:hypothetical protein
MEESPSWEALSRLTFCWDMVLWGVKIRESGKCQWGREYAGHRRILNKSSVFSLPKEQMDYLGELDVCGKGWWDLYQESERPVAMIWYTKKLVIAHSYWCARNSEEEHDK